MDSSLRVYVLTRETESRVANTRMSAQETMPGQAASSADFMSSMRSNPLMVRLGRASFSASCPGFESNIIDASVPYFAQKNQFSLSSEEKRGEKRAKKRKDLHAQREIQKKLSSKDLVLGYC